MLDVFEARGGTIEWGHARVSVPEAAHVIGADGPGSKVRQAMGARVEMRLGMQARVATDHETDHLEFLTDKRLGAEYAWWFPRGDAHNIGLLGDAGDEKRLPDVLEAFGVEGTLGKVEAFPIAFGGKQFVSRDGRTLLIGDAAGLTNPVTKGGIAAIVHAAPMLARAVAGGRPHSYQKTLDRHPLTHPSYLRALRRLRRWSQADLRRLLSVAPDPIHVLGTQRTSVAPIAARVLMRRPWSARAMLDFYQATARSIDWSW